MAQLDSLIIFPLLWSLIIVLFIYYTIMLKITIPSFSSIKKLRTIKLQTSVSSFSNITF